MQPIELGSTQRRQLGNKFTKKVSREGYKCEMWGKYSMDKKTRKERAKPGVELQRSQHSSWCQRHWQEQDSVLVDIIEWPSFYTRRLGTRES